jgi:hypothetical protein
MSLSQNLLICDPNVEKCEPEHDLLRPCSWHLFYMISVYGANAGSWVFMFSSFALYLIGSLFADNYTENESLAQTFVMMSFFTGVASLIFVPASNTLLTYFIFGSDFIFFRWTDDLGMWYVTEFIPSASLYYKLAVILYITYAWFSQRNAWDKGGLESYLLWTFISMALPLEFLQWTFGV